MPPENDPAPTKPEPPAAPGKMAALLAERERRRKELERQNARRAHKPNLKTIPWKK